MASKTLKLARRIRELKLRGLSDEDVAVMLGIHRAYVSEVRRIAWERWQIYIPRNEPRSELRDIIYGIVLAISRNNGGSATAGEVYKLYRIGVELGLWEERCYRALYNAIRKLEESGAIERACKSFGRRGITSILKPKGTKQSVYAIIVEECLSKYLKHN